MATFVGFLLNLHEALRELVGTSRQEAAPRRPRRVTRRPVNYKEESDDEKAFATVMQQHKDKSLPLPLFMTTRLRITLFSNLLTRSHCTAATRAAGTARGLRSTRVPQGARGRPPAAGPGDSGDVRPQLSTGSDDDDVDEEEGEKEEEEDDDYDDDNEDTPLFLDTELDVIYFSE